MVQVIEQGDIFGQVGKSFGEGLSKTLPQAIDRKLFSQDLKSIQDQDLQGNDLIVGLMNARGGTPEQKQQLLPILQEQSKARYLSRQNLDDPQKVKQDQKDSTSVVSGDGQVSGAPTSEGQNVEVSGEQRFGQDPTSLMPKGLEDRIAAGPPVADPQLIEQESARAVEESGGVLSLKEEVARRQRIADRDTALYEKDKIKYQTIKDQTQGYLDKFEKTLNLTSQKEGKQIYQDLSGPQIAYAEEGILKDIASKKLTPDQAIQKWARKANDFTTSKNSLKSSPQQPWFGRASKKNLARYKRFVKGYTDFGSQKELSDDLQNFIGIGAPLANSISYPTSESLQTSLDGISTKRKGFFAPPVSKYTGARKKLSMEQKNNILGSMKSTDSIYPVQLNLADKGYNDLDFLEFAREQSDSGEYEFNNRIKNELVESDQVEFTLPGIAWSFLTGVFNNTDTPVSKQLARLRGNR